MSELFDNMIRVTAHVDEKNQVIQDVRIGDQIHRKVIDMAALQLDVAVRQALINLGWTPPKPPSDPKPLPRNWPSIPVEWVKRIFLK